MRVKLWSPFPPQRSGIADYTAELVGELAALLEVVCVADDATIADVRLDVDGVTLQSATEARSDVRDGDIALYMMGNHLASHGWMYEDIVSSPGVVVMHDPSLLDLRGAMLGGLGSEAFRRELGAMHGPILERADAPGAVSGLPSVLVDGVRVPDRMKITMDRAIMENALAAIAHDRSSVALLRRRFANLQVHHVYSGAHVRFGVTAAARARLGWADASCVFGVFGGLSAIKRVPVVLLAFAAVLRVEPRARLIVAGHADDEAVVATVLRHIATAGLEASVEVMIGPTLEAFQAAMDACDVVINLRWPTAGETSAVMMRAFASGKPVAVSQLPQHADLDPRFCWQIPIDPVEETAVLFDRMRAAAADPAEAVAAGELARQFVIAEANWPVVAERYAAVLAQALQLSETSRSGTGPPASAPRRPGVNAIADFDAVTGLAEAARGAVVALSATDTAVSVVDLWSGARRDAARRPEILRSLDYGKNNAIDLWMLNINEMSLVPDEAMDRYAIAFWFWEMLRVPDTYRRHLDRIDELWVASQFVADIFRRITTKPVSVFPCVVEPSAPPLLDRDLIRIPDDGFRVLYTFDAGSSMARKNPHGVIEAFRRAFAGSARGSDAHLVVKASSLSRWPRLHQELAALVQSVNGTLITTDVPRAQMNALIAACDTYVSLHRSEGFGLGMAEAMALGKPVIASGFGGNTEFMTSASACLVGYELTEITEFDHAHQPGYEAVYPPGEWWAEPDVDDAARWLTLLAEDPMLCNAIGARAAERIRTLCSARVVGAAMARRLYRIDAMQTLEEEPISG